MNTGTQTEQLFGYDVTDTQGNTIGSVDGVWVDDATNRPEFIAVKTGMLFGKNHLMPVEQAQIDQASQTIQVPYSEDQIKGGPSFGTTDNLSPDDEQQIYSYYGMQRSTATSPTGYAAGGGPSTTGTGTRITEGTQDMTLSEEELQVGKRQEEAGRARLRKIVRTEHEEVPVELRHEEVSIERTPATGEQAPDTAFQEREIDVPVMREEPVVAKEAHTREQVRVGKDVQTEQRTVGGDIRREDVEIEEEGDTKL
jgi:uncharacterized protein (TIGR02271 family)